jgi:glycosyltransferase involved in cell wall biosynthesis
MWPESIRVVGAMQQSALLDWLEKIELFLYRNAAMVIPVTNSFKRKLVERGIDAARINVVTNGADLAHFRPREKDTQLTGALGLSGKFVAGYIGTHGLAHGLETLLETARLLQEEGRDDIRLLFLGDGASKASLRERTAQLDLKNVIFLDTVAKSDVVRYWSLLDVSIIHLRKTDLFTTVIPSKLFECMAMGIPVLHGVRGESAEIVESEEVGITFEPENASDLHDKLVALSEDRSLVSALGGNGVKSARKFDRAHLAGEMLRLIESYLFCREAPCGEKRERGMKMGAMDE